MRSWRTWAMQSALLLGLSAVVVQAADRDDRSRPLKPPSEEYKWDWVNPMNWFGSKEKEKPKDTKKKDGKKDAVKKADLPTLPSAADETRSRQAREEAELYRRFAVIDELRIVAQRRNDQAMLQQIEEMERKAFALYRQRTGARVPPTITNQDAESDLGRDADALLRRKPSEEPVYNVTTDRAKPRSANKEVDR